MDKVKEQVKYNPKWSDVKRTNRVRMDIIGKSNIILTLVFLLISLLTFGFLLVDVITDTSNFFSDGAESAATFSFNGLFLIFFTFALNSSLPFLRITRSFENKQKAMLGGCVNIADTFMHMPVKKVSLFKQSFRYFIPMLIFGLLPSVSLNVLLIVKPELSPCGGITAFTSIVASFFVVIMYLINFGIIRADKKSLNHVFTAALVIFYVFWFGSMSGVFNDILMAKPLQVLAGIPSICIVAASAVFILAVQKLYLEKREKNAPWTF